MDKKKYFNTDKYMPDITLEFRSGIALHLIEHFGVIAGKDEGEDSAGRSVLRLQTPEELVKRCFKIADLFTDEAERRGDIKTFVELKSVKESV